MKQWSLLNCELSLTSYFRGDASFVGLERIGNTWKWSNGDTASSLVWSNNSDHTVTCAALMKDTKYLAVPCTSANQYIGGCVVPHAGKKNTTLVLAIYTAHKKLGIFDFGAKFLEYIIISRNCWIML